MHLINPKSELNPENFISQYLTYIGDTEVPLLYHRWCAIAALGTFLSRQYSLKFGHTTLNPNMYVMLIGVPATRKSSAIKIAKKLLAKAGYDKFSHDKTSKEKFLLDLAGEDAGPDENLLEQNLWGSSSGSSDCREMWIVADEFNDFIGAGNMEFISMLGNLWDFEGAYSNRIKSGKSVSINNPTISILGGNTPVNFAHAFPPETLGQGFFSRLLLVHADPTGNKITFPVSPSEEETTGMCNSLLAIKSHCIGNANITAGAKKLLDKIYRGYRGIDDARFEHYSGRRFTHLLKLCLILSASRCSAEIAETDVIHANTVLTHTEHLMPKALGEFGKSRNSDIAHKVMSLINNTDKVITIKEIWAHVSTDLERLTDLSALMQSLQMADKIQTIQGGFLPKKRLVLSEADSDTIDYNFLTSEEREMTK